MMKKLSKRMVLLSLALALLTALSACGGGGGEDPEPVETPVETEETFSLYDMEGWWVKSEAYEPPYPDLVSFRVDPEREIIACYDKFGMTNRELFCSLDGHWFTISGDEGEAILEMTFDESRQLKEPSTHEVLYSESDEPLFEDRVELEGAWYKNGEDEEWVTFDNDAFVTWSGDPESPESERADIWEIYREDYDFDHNRGVGKITSISTYDGDFIVIQGTKSLCYRDGGDYTAYIHEEERGTPAEDYVKLVTALLGIRYHSEPEELEYPTYYSLRFTSDNSFYLERIENHPDQPYLFQDYVGLWEITDGNQLHLSADDFQSRDPLWEQTFDFSEIPQSLHIDCIDKDMNLLPPEEDSW